MGDGVSDVDARAKAHGDLIKERRLDLGLNRPAFITEMKRYGVDITADYLNKLESGRAPLARASVEVREGLRVVLGWSREVWTEKTGLYTPSPDDDLEDLFRPQLPARRSYEVPEALQEAMDRYGEEWPGLRTEHVRYQLSNARFYNTPQTPKEWLAFYLSIRKWLEKDN